MFFLVAYAVVICCVIKRILNQHWAIGMPPRDSLLAAIPRDRHVGRNTFWQDASKNKHTSDRKAPVLVDALCGDPGGRVKANRQ